MSENAISATSPPPKQASAESNGQLIVSSMIVAALTIIALSLASAIVFIVYEDKANIKEAEGVISPLALGLGTVIGVLGNALQAPTGIGNVLRAVTGGGNGQHPQ